MKGWRNSRKGFSAIEALMVVGLLSIFAVAAIGVSLDVSDETAFEITINRMISIRNGIIGNPDLREAGIRTDFGFLGDIGGLPPAGFGIAPLTSGTGFTPYAPNATARFGIGWRGPYVEGGLGETMSQDGWGTDFAYNPLADPPTLTSYGSDRLAGSIVGQPYSNDLVISLPSEFRRGKVWGRLTTGAGGEFSSNAEIDLYSANGAGALSTVTTSITSTDKGVFSFSNIAFGRRSVKIFAPSKAMATTIIGPITFTVDRPNMAIPPQFLRMGTVLTVEPRYPSAPNWNDYVRESDLTTACNGTETYPASTATLSGTGFRVCRHGGEHRKAIVSSETSCTPLTATDALGAFDWTCALESGTAVFYGKLKSDKSLGDLVDATAWKNNSLTVKKSGVDLISSTAAAWWGNTVEAAPIDTTATVALGTASTIYTIASSSTGWGYYITANKVALVTLKGASPATYTFSRTTNNCVLSSGEATPSPNEVVAICLGSHNFFWIEGRYKSGNPTTATPRHIGILIATGRFGRLTNLYVDGFQGNTSSIGLVLYTSTVGLIIDRFHIANCSYGIFAQISSGLRITNGVISTARQCGIYLENTNNWVAISNLLLGGVSTNDGIFLSPGGTNILVTGLSYITGAGRSAFYSMSSASNIVLQSLLTNGYPLNGLWLASTTSFITVVNAALSAAATRVIGVLNTANNLRFSGNIDLGRNLCVNSSTGANVGIVSTNCALQTPSTADAVRTFQTGVGPVAYGPIDFNDPINPDDDSFGDITVDTTTPVPSNWFDFASPWRFWGPKREFLLGLELSGFHALGSCSYSTSANCTVWDARALANADYKTYQRNGPAMSAGSACPAEVNGNVTTTSLASSAAKEQTFLRNAFEILLDDLGDDDGLCESNEQCLYAPNMGAYQGEGALASCTFSDGGGPVTGVTMRGYSQNGLCARADDYGRYLNGTSDYVSFGESGTDYVFTSGTWTFEARVRYNGGASTLTSNRVILASGRLAGGTSTTNRLNYALGTNSSGALTFWYRRASDRTLIAVSDTSGWTPTDRQHHHVAAVVSVPSDTVTFFVDGVQKSQVTNSFTTNVLGTNSNTYRTLDIGSDDAPSNYFRGTIFGVRISNAAKYTADFTPSTALSLDTDTVLNILMDESGLNTAPVGTTGAGVNRTGTFASTQGTWRSMIRTTVPPASCSNGVAP